MEERCIGAGGRGGYSAAITSDRRLHGRLAAGPRVAAANRLFSQGTGADGREGGRGAAPEAERLKRRTLDRQPRRRAARQRRAASPVSGGGRGRGGLRG